MTACDCLLWLCVSVSMPFARACRRNSFPSKQFYGGKVGLAREWHRSLLAHEIDETVALWSPLALPSTFRCRTSPSGFEGGATAVQASEVFSDKSTQDRPAGMLVQDPVFPLGLHPCNSSDPSKSKFRVKPKEGLCVILMPGDVAPNPGKAHGYTGSPSPVLFWTSPPTFQEEAVWHNLCSSTCLHTVPSTSRPGIFARFGWFVGLLEVLSTPPRCGHKCTRAEAHEQAFLIKRPSSKVPSAKASSPKSVSCHQRKPTHTEFYHIQWQKISSSTWQGSGVLAGDPRAEMPFICCWLRAGARGRHEGLVHTIQG